MLAFARRLGHGARLAGLLVPLFSFMKAGGAVPSWPVSDRY